MERKFKANRLVGKIELMKILFLFLILSSCYGQNCAELEQNFTNYEQAKKSIKSTNFNFSDKCNTSKSSWIIGAEYYSCDNQKGYFFIKTNKKTYIHKNFPKELWNEFKNANSFGKFYNSKVKGKYQLII